MPKASPYSDSHAIWRSDETTALYRGAEMIGTLTLRDQVESVRPPGAAKRETKALFLTALRFRDGLDDCLQRNEQDAFLLDEDELDELPMGIDGTGRGPARGRGTLEKPGGVSSRVFRRLAAAFVQTRRSRLADIRRPPFSVFSLQCVATFSTGSHRFPGASRVSGYRTFRKQVFLPGFRRTAAVVGGGGFPGQAQPAGLGGETQARVAGNPFVSFPPRIQRLHAAAGSQTGSRNHCHRRFSVPAMHGMVGTGSRGYPRCG